MEWVKKNVITLIIIILSASFSVATAYQILTNDINILSVYGQKTRTIVVKHIDKTKDDPLSERDMQNKVRNLEDDVQDHSIKINKHEDSIVVLDRDMAVQAVQYNYIIEKLEELIDK